MLWNSRRMSHSFPQNRHKGTIDNIISNEKYVWDVHILKSGGPKQSYMMQDSHPAIIERATFQAVQFERKSRSNIEETAEGRKRKITKYSSKKREQ